MRYCLCWARLFEVSFSGICTVNIQSGSNAVLNDCNTTCRYNGLSLQFHTTEQSP